MSEAVFREWITGSVLTPGRKLSMLELLLDECGGNKEFEDLVNDAAGRWRVGVRFRGARFVPVDSEELHRTVVEPALAVLAEPEFQSAEAAYKKALACILGGDPAGAITAVASAIEEMLKAGGAAGSRLQDLSRSGKNAGWFGAEVQLQIEKLEAFRTHSDAHGVGTKDPHLGMLVVHLGGALLLYLAQSGPFLEVD